MQDEMPDKKEYMILGAPAKEEKILIRKSCSRYMKAEV